MHLILMLLLIFVSILILLEVILEVQPTLGDRFRLHVSILILLEVILEDLKQDNRAGQNPMFQSLFYWK